MVELKTQIAVIQSLAQGTGNLHLGLASHSYHGDTYEEVGLLL